MTWFYIITNSAVCLLMITVLVLALSTDLPHRGWFCAFATLQLLVTGGYFGLGPAVTEQLISREMHQHLSDVLQFLRIGGWSFLVVFVTKFQGMPAVAEWGRGGSRLHDGRCPKGGTHNWTRVVSPSGTYQQCTQCLLEKH